MKTRVLSWTLFFAAFATALSSAAVIHGMQGPSRVDRGTRTVFSGQIDSKRTATVSSNGLVTYRSLDGTQTSTRPVPLAVRAQLTQPQAGGMPQAIAAQLAAPAYQPYSPNYVNVVFSDGISVPQDKLSIVSGRLTTQSIAQFGPPQYTSSQQINIVLGNLRADQMNRLFAGVTRNVVRTMASRTNAQGQRPLLDIANAFHVHISGATVPKAILALKKIPGVAYVGPDWTVTDNNTGAVAVSGDAIRRADASVSRLRMARPMGIGPQVSKLPTNYDIASTALSYQDAPGIDARAAYDLVEKKFGQLPGTGETITNVSVGDECAGGSQSLLGVEIPDSVVIGGQHYLKAPSMPLIPEFAVDGDLNVGSPDVCGEDSSLAEVLLDFSVMAPLPDNLQLPGEEGSGLTDLLGIAPGANFRLVVPYGSTADSVIAAAFLGAAQQNPKPDIITASLGIGIDAEGLPGRNLEEDPLVQSTLSTIVNYYNIPVFLSSGDGLRLFTNAAVAPSGGAASLNVTTDPNQVTQLEDVANSSDASYVMDSGVTQVGGTTTDDIVSANPQDPNNSGLSNQLTYPETRWDGSQNFASTYGSRVNLSAPSDNILALGLPLTRSIKDGTLNDAVPELAGGTSASTPETAAAAAVLLQVARLTNHPFANPQALRAFLESTGTPVVNTPQADHVLNVGPQVDLARGVQQLLSNAGMSASPALPEVAIGQRVSEGNDCLGVNGVGTFEPGSDANFLEAVDPTNISLETPALVCGNTGIGINSYITLAPDWEGIPPGSKYRLFVTGHPSQVIATSPWVRALPVRLLAAAGIALPTTGAQTITLTYEADLGYHIAAAATFTLTFAPTPTATSGIVLAPVVPQVVTGSTISVSYDLSSYATSRLSNPVIVVSYPGRTNPSTGVFMYPLYTSPVLTQNKGTIQIPVSALQGAGIYGIAVQMNPLPLGNSGLSSEFSDFAMTRVEVGGSSAQPASPLFVPAGASGYAGSHSFEMPLGDSFTVQWDVSNVPGATGGTLEFSAPGPNQYGSYSLFNNPGGSEIDQNGRDTGSVYSVAVSGTSGSLTLSGAQAHLIPGMFHSVRIIPTAGGSPVGEASQIGLVTMDGITAPDGQNLLEGYAINPTAAATTSNDAFFVDSGTTIFGGVDVPTANFGGFSQSTGVSEFAFQAINSNSLFSLVGGAFTGAQGFAYITEPNSGLVSVNPGTGQALSYTQSVFTGQSQQGGIPIQLRNDLTFGWVPALPSGSLIVESAGNTNGNNIVVLLRTQTPAGGLSYSVVIVNAIAKTVSTPVVVTPPAGIGATPVGFDYDPGLNRAYVMIQTGGGGLTGSIPTETLEVVDLTANTVTPKNLGALGWVDDFTIDPTTHFAGYGNSYCSPASCAGSAATEISNLDVMNLQTLTVASVAVPALKSANEATGVTNVAVDATNHLFLGRVYAPAADANDNNPLSEYVVVDENANLVSTSPRNYDFRTTVSHNHFFQANGVQRKAFTFGPNVGNNGLVFNQLVPLSY